MLLVIRRDPTLADAGTPRCTPAALQGLKEQTERAPPPPGARTPLLWMRAV